MKINQNIIERFEELIEFGKQIISGARSVEWVGYVVDDKQSSNYGLRALNLLIQIYGEKSDYYVQFANKYKDFPYARNFTNSLGILEAAKEDYENGYFFKILIPIEAEIFDDFLEQAKELFKKGYYQPAAVIAGCVLEDGLRKLCYRNSISLPAKTTIDPMNVELAKTGIYNKLIQKKITALADLRNKAAHGEWTEFTEKDVEDMIRDVRRFMEDYFS